MKVATPLIKSTLGAEVPPCETKRPAPLASCRLTEPVASLSRLPLASTACTVKLLALPLWSWAGANTRRAVAVTSALIICMLTLPNPTWEPLAAVCTWLLAVKSKEAIRALSVTAC